MALIICDGNNMRSVLRPTQEVWAAFMADDGRIALLCGATPTEVVRLCQASSSFRHCTVAVRFGRDRFDTARVMRIGRPSYDWIEVEVEAEEVEEEAAKPEGWQRMDSWCRRNLASPVTKIFD